ncbi:MAG: ectonucleotide pyrophosphatase/phosphodiesterase [Planctomycetes bacterium]|nr:ectonucleotide pyrophosphatase/phosphodiesterase [Planctomycetota bacterium]
MMRRTLFIPAMVVIFCAWAIIAHAADAPATQPAAQPTRRVLIVSIDGLRPDVLLRADAPNLRRLMATGSFSFWARTTDMAITIPSHTSMVTGVSPSKHGITWNGSPDLPEPIYPKVPTIFTLAHDAGLTTAMAVGKSKFYVLTRPETLDWSYLPKETAHEDKEVAAAAVKIIHEHRPTLLFVHLPRVDTTGHALGWGGLEQLEAVHLADAALGLVLESLDKEGLRGSTLVIVSADHGGAGRGHGPDDPRSRFIPWIVAGPGVRPNHDLTLERDLNVRTEDTFATACHFLGLTAPAGVEGKNVEQAFRSP